MFAKWLIRLTALIFFVYGVLFTVFPLHMLFIVADGAVSSSSGWIDIRSTYGGVSMALGWLLYQLSRQSSTVLLGLKSVFAIMTLMALSRVVGIILDGSPNWVMYIYLVLEVVVASISGYVLAKGSFNKP